MLKLRNDLVNKDPNTLVQTNIPTSTMHSVQPEDKSTIPNPIPNSADTQNLSEQKQDTDDNMDTFGTESNLNK